uniref:Uncharacterized protein n=1 Tax=Solanum lycopersicum TaxID=4081 RepID=A0A3Q7EYK3_SOLLC
MVAAQKQQNDTMLKTVNALPTTVHGFALKVPMDSGGWTGLTDFTFALIYMFDIILGLDFWYEVNTSISPRHNQLHISDAGGSCIVPLIRIPQNWMNLSVMQNFKGFKRDEPSFLVALVGGVENSFEEVVLPPCIEQVLCDNKDVMPKELPQRLPLRREVDHHIKLVPGAKPPAMMAYRMAPPEFEELSKQLKELMDSGISGRLRHHLVRLFYSKKRRRHCVCVSISGPSTMLR